MGCIKNIINMVHRNNVAQPWHSPVSIFSVVYLKMSDEDHLNFYCFLPTTDGQRHNTLAIHKLYDIMTHRIYRRVAIIIIYNMC